jgi:hypothetical protein
MSYFLTISTRSAQAHAYAKLGAMRVHVEQNEFSQPAGLTRALTVQASANLPGEFIKLRRYGLLLKINACVGKHLCDTQNKRKSQHLSKKFHRT